VTGPGGCGEVLLVPIGPPQSESGASGFCLSPGRAQSPPGFIFKAQRFHVPCDLKDMTLLLWTVSSGIK
jgi:hypothetical protein